MWRKKVAESSTWYLLYKIYTHLPFELDDVVARTDNVVRSTEVTFMALEIVRSLNKVWSTAGMAVWFSVTVDEGADSELGRTEKNSNNMSK